MSAVPIPQTVYCASCGRTPAQWVDCVDPLCGMPMPLQLETLADALRPLPTIGTRCTVKCGADEVEGVIVARVSLGDRSPGVYVETNEGHVIVAPVRDVTLHEGSKPQ
jgi:hypothetical protein